MILYVFSSTMIMQGDCFNTRCSDSLGKSDSASKPPEDFDCNNLDNQVLK